MRWLALVPALTGFLTFAPPARAMQAPGRGAFASADHWSRAALGRLAAAGLTETRSATLPWPMRIGDVRRLLAAAADSAATRSDPAVQSWAVGLLERFEADFPGYAGEPPVHAVGRVEAGWRGRRGELRGGASVPLPSGDFLYEGPVPQADASSPSALADVGLSVGPFAAGVRVRSAADRLSAEALYASAAVGAFDAWVGRRAVGFGAAPAGGAVVARTIAMDAVGIQAGRGIRLPGFLAALGPVDGAFALSRFERSGPIGHPWLAVGRLAVAPDRRLSLGINRGTLFAGEGNEPVTAGRLILAAIGLTDVSGKDSDFENSVASIDFRWTLPVDAPLSVYGEWGTDDAGRAFARVPALIAGADLESLPGLPALAIGIEQVHFHKRCCHHSIWYQHGALAEGWTDRGVLLGHPLGGHGDQTSVRWRYDDPERGVMAGGAFLYRWRGAQNLFAPDHAGRSLGATLSIEATVLAGLRLLGDLEAERGAGWWTGRWNIAAGWVF